MRFESLHCVSERGKKKKKKSAYINNIYIYIYIPT